MPCVHRFHAGHNRLSVADCSVRSRDRCPRVITLRRATVKRPPEQLQRLISPHAEDVAGSAATIQQGRSVRLAPIRVRHAR
jgi:hypothetical protein